MEWEIKQIVHNLIHKEKQKFKMIYNLNTIQLIITFNNSALVILHLLSNSKTLFTIEFIINKIAF